MSAIRKNLNKACTVFLTSSLFPFILRTGYTPFIHDLNYLFQDHIPLLPAMLYLDTALSITAFPMLVRILYEIDIARTKLGTLTITSGAEIDAITWCLLAVIMAIVRNNDQIVIIAIIPIIGAIIYVIFMISIGKILLSKLVCLIEQEKDLTISILAIVLSIVMLSSWLQIILKYMLFFENLSLDPLFLVENFLIR
ncbi:cation:proton antiporter domain-containing protein [Candidatus Coxiella mudrowiae]|uniref:cation:proton antiporter domain-containing protein n=1 Tax=Candidatus Coxiella mudrowiae TaxID=2054173 RepID=UPI000662469C|nr:cation:proton antiporter [Candidatus Coxiella mudrowiae]